MSTLSEKYKLLNDRLKSPVQRRLEEAQRERVIRHEALREEQREVLLDHISELPAPSKELIEFYQSYLSEHWSGMKGSPFTLDLTHYIMDLLYKCTEQLGEAGHKIHVVHDTLKGPVFEKQRRFHNLKESIQVFLGSTQIAEFTN